MAHGYSGTPLVKKLGIKENFKLMVHNHPINYFDLLADLPNGVEVVNEMEKESIDFIHLFCTSFQEFKNLALEYKRVLKKDGLLWISWPKGSSKLKTDLKRDLIREYLLANGLVDVKVAAIDENWSGLKFVYRLKDR